MIKIWYHRNCFDGFGAALAAWLKYGDTAEYYPVQYQSEYPTLEPGDELYIVDHSVKENHMNELLSISDNITVLDHHKTAEEELSPFLASGQVKGLFDMDKSGAVLSWEFFQPGKPLPKLFHAIQDRDLWHFKCEGTNEVNMALQLLPLDFAKWQKFLDDEHFLTLIPRGKDLLKYHNRQVKQSKRNAFLCELLGHEVPVVNLSTSSMISDVV
ncbi:MAG: hypothetical protein HOM11_06060, partial [Methylococcales bacterium]|nr:hypothetical protein [Methylococcales bacterium]